MKMKRFGFLCIVLAAGIMACGVSLTVATPVKAINLTGFAGPTGGLFYRYMSGVAKLVKENYPEISMSIVPGGAITNIARISKDPNVLGTTAYLQSVQALKGTDSFEGKPPIENLRLLISMQDLVYFYPIFAPEVPVENVRDIKTKKLGLRFCSIPRGSIAEWEWRKILEFTGITIKEIESWGGKMTYTNWTDMVNLMKDGHADVLLGAGAGKAGWLVNLTTARKINLVSLYEPAIDRFVKEYGGSGWGTLPANSYKGQEKPFKTLVNNPTGLVIANKDLPNDLAYKIVKAVCENAEKFRLVHTGQLKNFSPANAWKAGMMKVHDGAAKYYKEKGYRASA